jgi:hypothetical protein
MQQVDQLLRGNRLLTTDEWLQELLETMIHLEDARSPLKRHHLRFLTQRILFGKGTLTKALQLMRLPDELLETCSHHDAESDQPQQPHQASAAE